MGQLKGKQLHEGKKNYDRNPKCWKACNSHDQDLNKRITIHLHFNNFRCTKKWTIHRSMHFRRILYCCAIGTGLRAVFPSTTLGSLTQVRHQLLYVSKLQWCYDAVNRVQKRWRRLYWFCYRSREAALISYQLYSKNHRLFQSFPETKFLCRQVCHSLGYVLNVIVIQRNAFSCSSDQLEVTWCYWHSSLLFVSLSFSTSVMSIRAFCLQLSPVGLWSNSEKAFVSNYS